MFRISRSRNFMRLGTIAAGVLLLALPSRASAQPALDCYGYPTQINTVAKRDFTDGQGLVVKTVFYTSDERGFPITCIESFLRVQSTRLFTHDASGRTTVESEYGPDGRLRRVWRLQYSGEGKQPSRRTLFGPRGNRRYEIRSSGGLEQHLHFDDRERLVGLMGPVPADMPASVAWGPAVDGWSCGIAVGQSADTGREPTLYLHLRNHTAIEQSTHFFWWFETELRDARGALVPFTRGYEAEAATWPREGFGGRLVRPGEAAFESFELKQRYGDLPPGRYRLTVRHPNPDTRALLISNTLDFVVEPRRP